MTTETFAPDHRPGVIGTFIANLLVMILVLTGASQAIQCASGARDTVRASYQAALLACVGDSKTPKETQDCWESVDRQFGVPTLAQDGGKEALSDAGSDGGSR